MTNLLELKKDLEYKKSQRDKLLGKQDMLLSDLKKLGYKNISDAKKALNKMTTSIEKKEIKLDTEISDFEKEYEGLL